MQSERWQSCTDIFQAAIERPVGERSAFLDETCDGDDALRRKIELLLKYHEQSGDFIATPAFQVSPELLVDDADALIGQQLGHYRIESVLGVGGMGVVYLAEDERLGRKVGLKLLPHSLVTNEAQLERLKREARTASALNHPNIVTIHEIAEADGTHYIATEFIEGTTLRERMARGPIPTDEALDIATQIASALSVAHTAGIVHRDIKPENIMLRPDGYVKVLDFGIAKFTQQEPASVQVTTQQGIILGTTRYMSPEQARGLPVDARTDVWSLGVVLYEMVAGQPPFDGATMTDVIISIAEREPVPLATSAPEVPMQVDRTVRKALAKDREERHQTAEDLLSDLKTLKQGLEIETGVDRNGTTARMRSRKRSRIFILAAAALLIVAGLVSTQFFRPGSKPTARTEIKSLAVLPLQNLSGDAAQDYFADGMTDALIGDLARIGALRVISRTSTMHYKGTNKSLPEIARELQVDAVIEGTVQRSDGRVRIRAQLIHAATDRHLWAETYERDLRDALSLQSEIAQAVAREVQAKTTPAEQARVATRRPVHPNAFEEYLQGRYLFWNRRTDENLRTAIEHFQRAIREDSNYALAYVGLADCFNASGAVQFSVLPALEARRRAEEAAQRALELDPTLAEAHTALGFVKFYNWEWDAAEQAFKHAIEHNPNYANTHNYYASYLMSMGRIEEGFAASNRARELDPLSLSISAQRGFLLFLARRYDKSIEQLRGIIATDPNHYQAHWFLAHTYAANGQLDQAVISAEKAAALAARSPGALGILGLTYGFAGKKNEAKEVVKELLELNERRYVTPAAFVFAYTGLGDKDQAFLWMEKSYQERSNFMAYLKTAPLLDPLRSDPRFADLVRRVGPPAPTEVMLPEKSIAVLPLENLSDKKENAYFAAGIQDQILTKLASVADLKVISRISTAKYKSKPENLKTVAQELGVATVLEGTVQRAGGRVRITVQLIDARTDTHLWAKSYDRELKDVFDVQSEVAQQIADALRAKLSPSEATALAVAPTRDPEAYDLFLRGEYEMRQGESALTSPEPFDRAAKLYREAFSRDPHFALATARLAQSRLGRHWFVAPLTTAELEEVKKIVDHAVALAPGLAEAHVALALFYYWGHREYDAALAEFQRALELQPNNAAALQFRAAVYRRQGQWERSLGDQARAADLDPRDPKIPAEMAGTYCTLRQWSEARRVGLRALALDPQQVVATHAIAFSYVNGEGDIEAAKRALAIVPGNMRTNNRGAVATMIGYHAYLRVLERDFAGALKEAEKDRVSPATDVLPASVRTAICVLAGDEAGARVAAEEARGLLEAKLLQRPDDIRAISQLCWVYLALGRNADALRLAHQRAASLPIEKDAYWGPSFELGLAEIQARAGEARQALKTLRRLLTIPAGATVSRQRLRIDPVWDPIRSEPEFQQLLAGNEQIGPPK